MIETAILFDLRVMPCGEFVMCVKIVVSQTKSAEGELLLCVLWHCGGRSASLLEPSRTQRTKEGSRFSVTDVGPAHLRVAVHSSVVQYFV